MGRSAAGVERMVHGRVACHQIVCGLLEDDPGPSRAEGTTLLPGLIQIVASGASFSCTPIAVWDGDGPVWCAEGPKIRLAGIAAREIDGTCRSNQPCPSASGIAGRDHLVRLLGGGRGILPTGHIRVLSSPLRCVSEGSAGRSRTAAWCRTSSGRDLNCEMVATGTALRWSRYWRGHRC